MLLGQGDGVIFDRTFIGFSCIDESGGHLGNGNDTNVSFSRLMCSKLQLCDESYRGWKLSEFPDIFKHGGDFYFHSCWNKEIS